MANCEDTNSRVTQGATLALLRFPISRTLSCKNTLIKTFSIHQNYSGMVSGISDEICVVDGKWPLSKGVVVLAFRSGREAELWKDSVPEIKQQDWLDGVDMILVPVSQLPPRHMQCVEMTDYRGAEIGSYMQEIVASENRLQAMGACIVVSSSAKDMHKIRGLWDPQYLNINFWASQADFGRYQQEKGKLCVGDMGHIVFNLTPLGNSSCSAVKRPS